MNGAKDSLKFYEATPFEGGITVLGLPEPFGQPEGGVNDAPGHLRKLGLIGVLEKTRGKVRDLGNMPVPHVDAPLGTITDGVINLEGTVAHAESVAPVVEREILEGRKVVTLGGSHLSELGPVAGAAVAMEKLGRSFGVIVCDTHGEHNTPETSPSGNPHGMWLAALLGLGHPRMVNILRPGPKLKKENVLIIGCQDLDAAEIELMRHSRTRVITMMDIHERGWPSILEEIDEFCSRVDGFWLSTDTDAIDEKDAMATELPAKGGLLRREMTHIARRAGKTGKAVGVGLHEYIPKKDVDDTTGNLLIELGVLGLGGEHSAYHDEMAERKGAKGRSRKKGRIGRWFAGALGAAAAAGTVAVLSTRPNASHKASRSPASAFINTDFPGAATGTSLPGTPVAKGESPLTSFKDSIFASVAKTFDELKRTEDKEIALEQMSAEIYLALMRAEKDEVLKKEIWLAAQSMLSHSAYAQFVASYNAYVLNPAEVRVVRDYAQIMGFLPPSAQ